MSSLLLYAIGLFMAGAATVWPVPPLGIVLLVAGVVVLVVWEAQR